MSLLNLSYMNETKKNLINLVNLITWSNETSSSTYSSLD